MNENLRRSLLIATVAGLALFAFYVGVLSLVSGREFARSQITKDLPFLVFLVPGFGTQFGLFTYIRGLVRGGATRLGAAAGVNSAISGGTMVACCAHYVPTLLPFVGISAAATLIVAWRTPLLILALVSNAVGLAYMVRVLGKVNGMQRATPQGV